MDSSTVIEATLAYHIPGFEAPRAYRISAVFAGRSGGSFNRGGGVRALGARSGIVTLRHSLRDLLVEGREQAAVPLTGAFFLLEPDPDPPITEDTVVVRENVRIRMTTASRVRATSRTFFYNGAGASTSFRRSLVDRLEEYWLYFPHKAFAVAHGAEGRWVSGYAFGYRQADQAAERALRECRAALERREMDAECRLLAVDEEAAPR